MNKLKKDMFMYSFIAVISVVFYFVIIPAEIQLRDSWSGDITFTSRTFPNLLFITMGIAAVIGIITTVVKMSKLENKESTPLSVMIKDALTPIYFFIVLGVYALMFHYLGYPIATGIMIPLYLFSLKCKNIKYYVITYAIGIVVYIVFKYLLNITL